MGQFQSFRFFDTVKEELRSDFKFKKVIRQQAQIFLEQCTPRKRADDKIVRVGIHIRRTDHLKRKYRRQGFVFPNDSYFTHAMDYFIRTNVDTHVVFVIASDDIPWCKSYFADSSLDIFYSTKNTAVVDMAILSFCDHVIITIGTFGWWTGWLKSGTTVYMKDFPANGTWTPRVYRPEYYIPPDDGENRWIGM